MSTKTKATKRLCVFCGGEVTSTHPDCDYCVFCFYGGRSWEREFASLLESLRALTGVVNVAVWHTGGGCFNLAVTLADDRLLTPSMGVLSRNGTLVSVDPGFPKKGEKWAMVVADDEEAWSDWDEARLTIPQLLMTEKELIEAVAAEAKLAVTPAAGRVKLVDEIPQCDVCDAPGPYDFRVRGAGWSNGCLYHWREQRAERGLGEGRAQLWVTE